jgi:choline/carnitine/betaine transport
MEYNPTRWSEHSPDMTLLFLLSFCLVTGSFVSSAFVMPDLVGSLISGRAILVMGLTFVGAALTIAAVYPGRRARDETGESASPFEDQRNAFADRIDALAGETDSIVVGAGLATIVTFLLAVVAFPGIVEAAVDGVSSTLMGSGTTPELFTSYVLLGSMLVFVGFALVLLVGPWGRVRLGEDRAEPEFSYPAYFAMMFSAGIAAGIVFWGPTEAIYHFGTPPPFVGASPGTGAAMHGAIEYTMFHWGFSSWCAYLAVGLPIAYFAYNHDAPMRVSTLLTPFVGLDNLDSPVVKVVDVLAVFATMGGIATSMWFVTDQFLTGIEYRWTVTLGDAGMLLFVFGLTAIVTVSAVSGVHRGIRRLSGVNVSTFFLLAVGVFVVGPTLLVLETGISAFGAYLVDFVPMSVYVGESSGAKDWVSAWTVFYWVWWLSWAPFAGLFLARISRGRRIRTVVSTGVVATTLATLVWFVIIGATSIHVQQTGTANILAAINEQGKAVSGHLLFDALPLGGVLTLLFLLLIITFFVTSADSSTLTLAMLATGDVTPSAGMRVFWGGLQGLIVVVLFAFGGANVFQTAAVVTGGPFALFGLLAVIGMVKTLSGSRPGSGGVTDRLPPDRSLDE